MKNSWNSEDLLNLEPEGGDIEVATEAEMDEQIGSEMEAIASMMHIAMKEGLETEVIHWYGQFRANGEDVISACYHALGEWIK